MTAPSPSTAAYVHPDAARMAAVERIFSMTITKRGAQLWAIRP